MFKSVKCWWRSLADGTSKFPFSSDAPLGRLSFFWLSSLFCGDDGRLGRPVAEDVALALLLRGAEKATRKDAISQSQGLLTSHLVPLPHSYLWSIICSSSCVWTVLALGSSCLGLKLLSKLCDFGQITTYPPCASVLSPVKGGVINFQPCRVVVRI